MNKNNVLTVTSFVLLFFASFFWYCAEAENEILREEIAMLEYSKPFTTEANHYDR